MFGKKKSERNRFIVAVKDYGKTMKLLKEGSLRLFADKAVYLKMLESQSAMVDNTKELKKFVKISGKSAKDVMHYWEGLIVDGYTLLNVEYNENKPSIDQLCNTEAIRFISNV